MQKKLKLDFFDLRVVISKDNSLLKNLVESRFINLDDLDKLDNALQNLNQNNYQFEIEKLNLKLSLSK